MSGRGLTIRELQRRQKAGLIKGMVVHPKVKKKTARIPRGDCPQVSWMKWNLRFMCNNLALEFKEEYRFTEDRMWRFDMAIASINWAAEYDGLFSEKSGHTTHKGFMKDQEKLNEARHLGWTVFKYHAKNYKRVLVDLERYLQTKSFNHGTVSASIISKPYMDNKSNQ